MSERLAPFAELLVGGAVVLAFVCGVVACRFAALRRRVVDLDEVYRAAGVALDGLQRIEERVAKGEKEMKRLQEQQRVREVLDGLGDEEKDVLARELGQQADRLNRTTVFWAIATLVTGFLASELIRFLYR